MSKYFQRQVISWALDEKVLNGRMSFIAGPRQIGKTTAVQQYFKQQRPQGLYYNWDTTTVKKRFAHDPTFFTQDITAGGARHWVCLDEIHKYPKWKNLLKGYYDEWKQNIQFIIAGSARLDFFRQSGDSLVGRYFLFWMLPLGIREILSTPPPGLDWHPRQTYPLIPLPFSGAPEAAQNLFDLTGFPEPLSVGSQDFTTRWRDNYISLILREDLRDLTKIFQIRKLETLLYLLPEHVGSPLSLLSLTHPLECAYGSVRSWLDALKRVFLIFSISPWIPQLSRSLRKEKKYYFWDWGMVSEPGPRFENFIAVQLQRVIAFWNEHGKGPYHLCFVRTKDGQEVDFAIADRKKVWMLVEAKDKETAVSKSLIVLRAKLGMPLAVQVVRQGKICMEKEKGLFVMDAGRFLSWLP